MFFLIQFGPESTFDLKFFCELRPGLIGWCVLNFGMLCSQVEQNQFNGLTGSMFLINVFQLIYVWDALYNERAILTTMDITTDGFGMVRCLGGPCRVAGGGGWLGSGRRLTVFVVFCFCFSFLNRCWPLVI